MAKRNLVLIIALLLLVPAMLVGCAKSDSAAIKGSINGFASAYNAKDYDKCTEYLLGITDATKDVTKGLLALAREASGEVEITKIEDISVDGDSATAKVTVEVKGQTSTNTASFTKVDGKWKFGFGDLMPK